jgi:3',5'-cyclic AMP phosphodiesterase CpdA
MLICQISDLHIRREGSLAYGIVDTSAMLERCVSQILALAQRPVAVIATGDLVDFGRPEETGRNCDEPSRHITTWVSRPSISSSSSKRFRYE